MATSAYDYVPVNACKYERIIIKNKCKNPDDCSICLDSLFMKQVAYLPCKHSFHQSCLKQVFEKKMYSCPLCRYDLMNALKKANFIFPPVYDAYAGNAYAYAGNAYAGNAYTGNAYIYTYTLPYAYNGDAYMNDVAYMNGDAYMYGDAYMNDVAYNGDAYMNGEPGSYPDMPDLVDSDEDMPDLVDLSHEPNAEPDAEPPNAEPDAEPDAEPNSHWTGLLIYIMQASDMQASDMPASDMPASDMPASDMPASDMPGNNAEPEVLFRL